MAVAGTGGKRREARPVADFVGRLIEPACRKRGFAAAEIVTLWREIVDSETAAAARPERIDWPRKAAPEAPGTLVLAADNGAALFLSHAAPIIIERVNAFLGWRAIERIRMVPRPPGAAAAPPKTRRAPDRAALARVAEAVAGVADPDLAAALRRLGAAVAADHPTPTAQFRPNPSALSAAGATSPIAVHPAAGRPRDATGDTP